ncbi:MAG: type II toxin-antitoxin system RelE/ParE family toxin [Salinivirgaceae bacterium]
MIVQIDRQFSKDTRKINDKQLLGQLADLIENVQESEKISDLPNCKKLKGNKNAYRIRLRDYRIGFILENEAVVFIRFLNRKDIYKFFP